LSSASKVYNDLKDESIAKKKFCEAKLEDADDEVREEMSKIDVVCLRLPFRAWVFLIPVQEEYSRDHTSDHANNEIAEQQQKLELVMEANPGAVEQYERRKAEVSNLVPYPSCFADSR
jgi:chromosome segregation ATPase